MPPSPILTVPILAYHHIAAPPPESTSVSTYLAPAAFARQVRLLKAMGYRSVKVGDVARALRGETELPRRAVVFTFDDGWLDVYTEAFPILSAADFAGTLFLVGNALGHRGIAYAESREKAPQRVLSREQIRELAGKGWEIGAHSNSHVHLTRLSEADARRDIEAGRREVEAMFGTRPEVLAWPYGDCHGGLARLAEEIGFLAACSTVPGRRHRPEDRYVLRRVPIAHGMSAARFVWSALFRRYARGEGVLRRMLARDWSPVGERDE